MPSVETLEDQMFPAAAGIRLDADPDDLPPGSLSDCCNVDLLHPAGTMRPRYGSRSLPAWNSSPNDGHPLAPIGNSNFDFTADVLRLIGDDANALLYALALVFRSVGATPGRVQIYKADLSADSPGCTLLGGGLVDSERVPGAALYGGKLFIAPGVDQLSVNIVADAAGVYTNATFPPKPTVAPTTGLGAGGLTAVTGYIYAYLYLDSHTGARGPTKAGVTTGAFTLRNVTVTVTGTAAAGFDKIEIYRTTDGGTVFRRLATVANPGGGVTTSYADSTTDDRLSYIQPPARTGRTPTCRFVLSHLDRMIWAYRTEGPVDRNVVYHSEAQHPFACDPTRNFLTVRPDDGDEISGLAKLYNRAFVFKTRQIYELADNRPDSPFRIDPVVNEGAVGCVAHATLVEIEGRLFFLSWMGVAIFDGQSPRIVPGPLAALAAEAQITGFAYQTDPSWLSFNFRQGDVVSETFNFRVAFFTDANKNPNVDTAPITGDTSAPSNFRLGGANTPFPTGGVVLAPGAEAAISFDGRGLLQAGRTYYVWVQPRDGLQDYDWRSLGAYTFEGRVGHGMSVNWGLAGRFHAIDYWPAHEYWLFTASPGSSVIDTKWILDYRTIDAEGGPVWRRDVVHATAAVLMTHMHIDATHRNLNLPLFGDGLGCLWAGQWPDVDHLVSRQTPLTGAQRVQAVMLAKIGTLYHLDALVSPSWPTSPTLRGERVVIVDAQGQAFTGIVSDNSASRLVVTMWLEGRTPPDGSYTAAIGGLDAHVDFYPQKFGGGQHAIETRQALLHGGAQPGQVDVEVWTTDSVQLPSRESEALLRRCRRSDVAVGRSKLTRKTVRGRGLYAGGRLSSWRPAASWGISSWGLAIRQTGSRK